MEAHIVAKVHILRRSRTSLQLYSARLLVVDLDCLRLRIRFRNVR